MKKIALITSFCNTEEKLKILHNNLISIKEMGLDTMVFSFFHLPQYITDLTNYTLIIKENPVFTWPGKYINYWYGFESTDFSIHMSTATPDYGYAVLNQIKRMSKLALSMDYDHFFIIDYDLNINETAKNILLDSKPNSFYPGKRGDGAFPVSLYLVSLNKKYLTKFTNLISEETYLVNTLDSVESWLHKILPYIPGIIENQVVEDLVYNYQNTNIFDYSLIKDIKLFIHKIENQDIKFIFYGFKNECIFTIKTEDFIKEYTVKEWEEINLPYKIYDSLIIIYKEKEYNFTKIVNEIKFNLFKKTLSI